jgi:hypothetical protein
MGRYVNRILTITGLAAIAALAIDAFTSVEILPDDGIALMCVIAAVPLVVAAIRVHTESTKAALAVEFADYAVRMESAVERHGDRVCKNTVERVLQALAKGQMTARLDRADAGSFTDTGPFRIPR